MRLMPRFRALRTTRSGGTAAVLLALMLALTSAVPRASTPVGAQTTSDCTQMPPAVQPSSPPGYAVIDFTNACGRQVPLAVDIATNAAEWQTGLMNIADLPQDQGELFDFANADAGREIQFGFWMEDTLVPLSVAFVGEDSTLHEVQDMQAETTDVHTPSQSYLYAIEANLGWYADNDIEPGSQVNLTDALALASPNPRP